MFATTKRLSPLKPLRMAAFQFLACFVVVVIRAFVVYGTGLWNNQHAVNFLTSWIPAVVSVIVGILPDKEWERRMRVRWRVTIIVLGMCYSSLLWHQQSLNDEQSKNQMTQAIDSAVKRSDDHADEQFKQVTSKVGGIQNKVGDLGQQLRDSTGSLSSKFEESTSTISTDIGKVTRPTEPEKSSLQFTLWAEDATAEMPVLSRMVHSDSDGNYPIEFTYLNPSDVTAEAIDIWITVCDSCSFAKEPTGFDRPTGMDAHSRHRTIANLNPGTSIEKLTVLVSSAAKGPFVLVSHYSCKTCGKPRLPVSAKITPLPTVNIPIIQSHPSQKPLTP